jgi:hypothetical protein
MTHAFLRPGSEGGPGDLEANKMVDLNDLVPPNSGWLLHWASAINDKRQIVGTGTYNVFTVPIFLLRTGALWSYPTTWMCC